MTTALEIGQRGDERGLEALRREAAGWADVMRAPFESQGADVRAM